MAMQGKVKTGTQMFAGSELCYVAKQIVWSNLFTAGIAVQVVPHYAKNWHGSERKFVNKFWFAIFPLHWLPNGSSHNTCVQKKRAQDTPLDVIF